MLSGNFVAANIRISTLFQVKDRSAKTQESLVDPFVQDSDTEAKHREELKKAFKAKPPVVWRKEETVGELDFSAGDLLSVRESVAKAREVFKSKFDFDGRTADQLVFWQGRFTKQAFLDYLKKVSIPFEPALSPTDDALLHKNLNDLLKSRIAPLSIASMPSGFDKDDLFGGRTMTAGDFANQNARWKTLTSKMDVDPSEPIVFKPAFAFSGYSAPHDPNNIEDHARSRWSVIIRP